MQRSDRICLRDVTLAIAPDKRWISDGERRFVFSDFVGGSCLNVPVETLRGRSVLIASQGQLPAVLAAIELDGIASRVLLCLPDLGASYLPTIMRDAAVDTIVWDGLGPAGNEPHGATVISVGSEIKPAAPVLNRSVETEWVLFTSGTTGQPKMVRHTLPSLTGPIDDGLAIPSKAVWSTFYDVRRYGGLQILLRALVGGASMVLSRAEEPVGEFLTRAGEAKVSHISGTPSHWRRVLMSSVGDRIAPDYVRLSGEVADQAILDQLQRCYPAASVAHAFASTEAGVAFDVRDGLAGFQADYLDQIRANVELRVEDGTLRIRSSRTSIGYLGDHSRPLRDPDGFVDTGDMVERRGNRYYFHGRREGIINVGGAKVHPEEVEAIINQHQAVRMSRVWARSSPIMGAVVAADVVLQPNWDGDIQTFADTRTSILDLCRRSLAAHKIPVTIRQVPSLEVAPSGKLVRQHA
jgi:acyl-coenzyme A synthetase/AMP-(fatty) acid ligase